MTAYETTYPTEDYQLNTTDAADLLGKHIQYVRILARTGKIPAVRSCGRWMFCRQQILDQLRQDTTEVINKNTENNIILFDPFLSHNFPEKNWAKCNKL